MEGAKGGPHIPKMPRINATLSSCHMVTDYLVTDTDVTITMAPVLERDHKVAHSGPKLED